MHKKAQYVIVCLAISSIVVSGCGGGGGGTTNNVVAPGVRIVEPVDGTIFTPGVDDPQRITVTTDGYTVRTTPCELSVTATAGKRTIDYSNVLVCSSSGASTISGAGPFSNRILSRLGKEGLEYAPDSFALNGMFSRMSVSPSGSLVAMWRPGSAGLLIISKNIGATYQQLTFTGNVTGFQWGEGESVFYVSHTGQSAAFEYQTGGSSPVRTFATSAPPAGLSLNSSTEKLFASFQSSPDLDMIDLASGVVTKRFASAQSSIVRMIAVPGAGGQVAAIALYDSGPAVYVFSSTGAAVGTPINIPEYPNDMDAGSAGKIFMTLYGAGNVAVLDVADNKLSAAAACGLPDRIAANTDFIYVTCLETGRIAKISSADLRVEKTESLPFTVSDIASGISDDILLLENPWRTVNGITISLEARIGTGPTAMRSKISSIIANPISTAPSP